MWPWHTGGLGNPLYRGGPGLETAWRSDAGVAQVRILALDVRGIAGSAMVPDAPVQGGGLSLGLLGPLTVERSGEPVPLGGRQQRAVLAFLLTHSGPPVGVSVLADALWGERVPAGSVQTVQTYVSHLRDALEPGRDKWAPSRYIRTERNGYRLVLDGDQVDAVEFEDRVARGLAAVERADFEAGKAALTAGLGLWRGAVLADLADYGFVPPVAARYAELRAAATEALIDARLGLGEHRSLIPELDALIAADPLRERLHGQRMLTLYRASRQSDALAGYRTLRALLDRELGIEPGRPIQQLHASILAQDPALDWHPPAPVREAAAGGASPARRHVGAPFGLAGGAGDLLERDGQLAALERHLSAVTTSMAGRFVFIGGEAGVGKTSLLRRFCAKQPARILSGACDALATPHPLGPFLDIAAISGRLQDVIAGGGQPYEVAASLLDELRSSRPSILVLEDLHWADDATLDVVRLLARRLETVPVLALGTYRDDQIDRSHRLRVLIGELATWPGVVRLGLSPLSARAVAELAAPYRVDAAELYRSTGGNPFFVSEVLAAGGSRLPQTVQDAVLARVARLGTPARGLVESVAIVPAGIEVGLLEALEPAAMDSVEECLASGVLTSTAGGVAFRHELARMAVEISLPANRRIALHRAALAALSDPERGPVDPARLSHHAEAAADPEAVQRFAPAAAAIAAQVGAHSEAAAQYARALRFAQNLPEERRAELLSKQSTECHLIGDYRVAIETRKAAVEAYRHLGDRLREGDALRAMSANLRCFGRVPEASAAGRAALEILEPLGPGHELALAYANRTMLALNIEDAVATRAWGVRTQELAEQIGDRASLVHAMNSVGTLGYLLGDDDGRADLERSLDLCKSWGFREQTGRAYIHLAWASVRRHDYGRAAAYCREGLEYCVDHGLDAWRFEILGHQARRLLDQGSWGEATEATAGILGSLNMNTNAVARVLGLTVVALLRSRRGDPDHDAPMQEARAIAAPTGEIQLLLPVATATAEIAWLKGEPEAMAAADSATGEVLDQATRYGASSAISELAAWRRRCGLPTPAIAVGVGPYALELAGDPGAAAAAWLDLNCEYEAAVALCAGDAEHHREALGIFQRLETRPAAAIAARLLREGGARGIPRGPRPSTKGNPAGLTTRELEVLGLIGQDMRNREIAQRLHVAEKTVDHHVGAILAKLGVSSRGQAARAAARLGIGASR